MKEHRDNKGKPGTFAGRYFCYNLIYYERHSHINHAIEREDELKLMNRKEKEELIKTINPKMLFLNIYG
jgi:putative endonuclease